MVALDLDAELFLPHLPEPYRTQWGLVAGLEAAELAEFSRRFSARRVQATAVRRTFNTLAIFHLAADPRRAEIVAEEDDDTVFRIVRRDAPEGSDTTLRRVIANVRLSYAHPLLVVDPQDQHRAVELTKTAVESASLAFGRPVAEVIANPTLRAWTYRSLITDAYAGPGLERWQLKTALLVSRFTDLAFENLLRVFVDTWGLDDAATTQRLLAVEPAAVEAEIEMVLLAKELGRNRAAAIFS